MEVVASVIQKPYGFEVEAFKSMRRAARVDMNASNPMWKGKMVSAVGIEPTTY
jgi:hypothetical protein